MNKDLITYIENEITESIQKRKLADEDVINAKTREQRVLYQTAGIRADEKIKVLKDILRRNKK